MAGGDLRTPVTEMRADESGIRVEPALPNRHFVVVRTKRVHTIVNAARNECVRHAVIHQRL